MTKTLKASVVSVVVAIAAMPMAFAQSVVTATCYPNSLPAILTCIGNFTGFAQTVFFAIAVLFILWAAFKYLTAAGNEDKVGEARRALVYAVLAILIAVLAPAIVSLIQSTF